MPEKDLEIVLNSSYIPWSELAGKSVLITGANGLIGINLLKYIFEYSKANQLGIKLIALVRNKEKLFNKMAQFEMSEGDVKVVVADVLEPITLDVKVDYIIHAAAPTSSKGFVESPVETIDAIVNGTLNILNLAKEKSVSGFVYLSTMELFGNPRKNEIVNEETTGSFDTRVIRNSYPLSKQVTENLCCGYAKEHNLNIKIVRLTQTFGPGVEKDDGRVFAEFARCVIDKKDIVLKTRGQTERCYLYTIDAVTAILTVLLKGDAGEMYIAANQDTYCSIYDMAQMLANKAGTKVVIQESDISKLGYADELHMNLSSEKLQKMGWKPVVGLEEMFERMIEEF